MTENTTEPRPNVPLLRKAVEWVEAEAAKPAVDREWYQGTWVSSPDYFARNLAADASEEGDNPMTYRDEIALAQMLAPHCGTAYCVAGYIAQLTDERYAKTDQVGDVHCSALAREALGLTADQAQVLFAGGNTAAEIRTFAEEFAGEAL